MPAFAPDGLPDDASTVMSGGASRPHLDVRVPAWTILAHPRRERVGERVLLPELAERAVAISRREPLFAPPGGGAPRALDDLHLSRRPILLERGLQPGTWRFAVPPELRLEIVGFEPGDTLTLADLDNGIPFVLGGRVALLLHLHPTVEPRGAAAPALVGASAAMGALRLAIAQAARQTAPVLVRGETGSGKELAARAIHLESKRRDKPYLAVNLAALPPTLAAAELFGAARGAYTGADRRRDGFFARAEGGTLFLDEIGEAPLDLQAALLRVLENGEIQPVGGEPPRRVDVRVIAATDADLERAVAEGRFRAPLLHRLQGDAVSLPPLRRRRDDVGRLLLLFLGEELAATSRASVLDPGDPKRKPWLPAALVARLAAADWAGNVRELRNLARRLAAHADPAQPAALPPELEAALPRFGRGSSAAPAPAGPAASRAQIAPSQPAPRPKLRAIADLPESEVLAALELERFNLARAARRLGVSRTGLYGWLERRPGHHKAAALGKDEILAAFAAAAGDFDRAAELLAVSRHGLRLRRSALGLDDLPP